MKYNKNVSSSRRKARCARYNAPSHIRRIMMSAPLSKELREKYHVRSLPIRKDDEVVIVRGDKGKKKESGKVVACYRKKWVIHIEKITGTKLNGGTYFIGIDPSNVQITKLKLDKDRRAMLARKDQSKRKAAAEKGKVAEVKA